MNDITTLSHIFEADRGIGNTSADMYFAPTNPDGSVPTQFYRAINVPLSELTQNTEEVTRPSFKQDDAGDALDSATRRTPSQFKFSTDSLENKQVMAMAIMGRIKNVAEKVGTFNVTAALSKWLATELGHSFISDLEIKQPHNNLTNQGVKYSQLSGENLASLTITTATGNDQPLAVQVQNSVELIVELGTDGAGALDNSKNTIALLLAAISDSSPVSALVSAELVEGTDSATVLTAVTKTNFVEKVTYDVANNVELITDSGIEGGAGMLQLTSDSQIPEGEKVQITGKYIEPQNVDMVAGSDINKNFYVKIFVRNPFSGNSIRFTYPNLRVAPDGALSAITAEVGSMSFTCTPKKPQGKNVPSDGTESEYVKLVDVNSIKDRV